MSSSSSSFLPQPVAAPIPRRPLPLTPFLSHSGHRRRRRPRPRLRCSASTPRSSSPRSPRALLLPPWPRVSSGRRPLPLPAAIVHGCSCLATTMGRGRNSRRSGVGEAALRAAVGGTPGARESRATVVGKVVDAYRSSNNNLRTLLQNLVDVGVVDVFGGAEDDDLRALVDVDLPGWDPDLSVMWKLLAIAAFSFTGVPVLLGCLVDAASARVQAWMPLVYSLASFVLGTCWSWMRR